MLGLNRLCGVNDGDKGTTGLPPFGRLAAELNSAALKPGRVIGPEAPKYSPELSIADLSLDRFEKAG